MTEKIRQQLKLVHGVLEKVRSYQHAMSILSFDQETICPEKGMEEQGEVTAFLGAEAFRLRKDRAFIEAAEALYEDREELDPLDREPFNGVPLDPPQGFFLHAAHFRLIEKCL